MISVFFEAHSGLAYFVLAPLFVRAFALSVYSRHVKDSLGGRLNRVMQFVGSAVGALAGLVLIGNRVQLFFLDRSKRGNNLGKKDFSGVAHNIYKTPKIIEDMEQKEVERVLREFVDGEMIVGASLLKTDGRIVATHYRGIKKTIPTIIARESLSAKRRRRNIFPVLGRLMISIAIYKKMCIGLASVSKARYIELIAKPELPLATFCTKLNEISNKLRLSKKKR